jgi:hypothetical protein
MIGSTVAPLQLSWLVDYVPPWLGPALLAVGLILMFASMAWSIVVAGDSRSVTSGGLAVASVTIGAGLLLVPLYFEYTYIAAAGLLLAGRWLEGVAATRLLTKVTRFVTGTSSGSIVATIKRRLRRLAIVFAIILIAGWAAIWVLLFGSVAVSRTYDLTLIWTLAVGVLSLLGLGFKFVSVDSRAYKVAPRFIPMVFAVLLAVTGAQLYNFELFERVIATGGVEFSISALDPILLITGNVVYLGGLYWSVRKRLQELS